MAKLTEERKELIVAFMEDNPQLVSCKFTATFTAKTAQQLWQTLADSINSTPGPKKSADDCRKSWHGMRRVAKDKQSRINVHSRGTGGGEPSQETLTPIQERIVSIIGATAIEGHTHIESIIITEEPDDPVPQDFGGTDDQQDWTTWDRPSTSVVPTVMPSTPIPSSSAPSERRAGVGVQKKRRIRAPEARLLQTKDAAEKYHQLHLKKLAVREEELKMLKKKVNIKENFYSSRIKLKEKELDIEREKVEVLKAIAEAIKLNKNTTV